jgi:hypothetical protein
LERITVFRPHKAGDRYWELIEPYWLPLNDTWSRGVATLWEFKACVADFRVGLLIAAYAVVVSPPIQAIVVRHDVDDIAFLEFAQRFPAVASVRCADRSCGLGAESTLIDPRWLLTAAHVATTLRRGDTAEIGGAAYPIERVVLHPEWQSEADIHVDIALVKLAQPVADIAPVPLYSGTDEVGMLAVFVGRGGTGTGLTGPVTEDLRLRAATNRVESVVGDSLLRFRFDSPGEPDVTELEGISGPGDSGGPAFVERDGALYVIGVGVGQNARPANGKRGHYKVLELYTRVSAFAGWVRNTLAEAEQRD